MIICDTHCDVLWMRAFEPDKAPCVTPENMAKGGISLQTCTLFAGAGGPEKHPYERAMAEYGVFRKLREEGWMHAFSPLEAEEGRTKIMLSVEGGEIFEGSVERVREFYEYGVRMAALTWNWENEIASPAAKGGTGGIKKTGWAILKEMEKLKMAADTSHLNEAGFWDLIERHGQPCMASHSCCRALCDHFRNLTDEQILALIRRDGWLGINFYPTFLSADGKASVETVCDHIDHVCQLGGAKHVGLGSDFDGIEKTPAGLSSPAEVPHIFEELRRRGYSEESIADIAGLNFQNYYRRLGWEG